ncbi:hypothetical protein Riv7116_3004 [Rivularia sp. PCC 7116]|nr:hypothetical protein Riv7116_3004 [Rivularia sp. PCC 7116]
MSLLFNPSQSILTRQVGRKEEKLFSKSFAGSNGEAEVRF